MVGSSSGRAPLRRSKRMTKNGTSCLRIMILTSDNTMHMTANLGHPNTSRRLWATAGFFRLVR